MLSVNITSFKVARLLVFLIILASASSYCPESSIRWVDCTKNYPSTLDIHHVDLKKLPKTLRCGRIDVPMDYSKPMSKNNKITLGLATHSPVNPKGNVFVNVGGSDPEVVQAWQIALNQTTIFDGLADYELIMMDVRGTYSSNPLNVSLATLADIPIPYPQSEEEFQVFKKATSTFYQSWIDSSSPRGIVEFVGTREVVQDFEQIRKAFGYSKINFLGLSYGSYRAQQYALTFPDRVNNFALDAVFSYGDTITERATHQIQALNRAVLRADFFCQNNASCPFHSQGRGSIPKAFKDIMADLEEREVSCHNNCSAVIPPAVVAESLFSLFQGQPDFPYIFDILEDGLKGNFDILLSGEPSINGIVALPLECGDTEYNKITYGEFKKALEAALEHDKTGLGRTQVWQLQLYCSGWPFVASPGLVAPNKEKMLLVTADFDLSAPTEWTTTAWNNAENSALVVRHGDDHVSFLLADQISSLITTDFIRTGDLPWPRQQPLVTVYGTGTPRGPIADPYKVQTGILVGDIDSAL